MHSFTSREGLTLIAPYTRFLKDKVRIIFCPNPLAVCTNKGTSQEPTEQKMMESDTVVNGLVLSWLAFGKKKQLKALWQFRKRWLQLNP